MPRTTTPANGPAIRTIRERSNLTVRQVVDLLADLPESAAVHVHEDHLRNVETGARNAGMKLINGLANVLQVPIVALLGPSEPKPDVSMAARK